MYKRQGGFARDVQRGGLCVHQRRMRQDGASGCREQTMLQRMLHVQTRNVERRQTRLLRADVSQGTNQKHFERDVFTPMCTRVRVGVRRSKYDGVSTVPERRGRQQRVFARFRADDRERQRNEYDGGHVADDI